MKITIRSSLVAIAVGASTVGGLSIAAPAAAQSFSYSDFSSTAGLQLNGSTTTQTDANGRQVLRITPAAQAQSGSAFSLTQIALASNASFSTSFTFNINNNDPFFDGADGFVFVVQTNSNDVGAAGGGLGYQGIANSLGIEFDTYENDGEINGNHVGIDLNGDINSASAIASPFQLDGGTDLTAFIDYNGDTQLLEVRLSDSAGRPATALLSYANLDLRSILGSTNAFVGFTSGTGSGYSNHDVVNWQFNNSFAPIESAVPEPATWAMMLVGFGMMGASMRYRRRSTKIVYA